MAPSGLPLLSLMTFLPLAGAVAALLVRGENAGRGARAIGLAVSLAVLALACVMMAGFDPARGGFQFVEKVMWLPALGLTYHVGVDGISVFFVLLSALLTPVCLLASAQSVGSRVREYVAAFLVLETFMIGTFAALDTILFYVFFEGVLIPMFLIIGVWGGPRRIYAAFKFFLFTLFGSVLMLVALLVLYAKVGTTDIPLLMANPVGDLALQKWLWLAMFASFAVKMPMWPVHTWLPDAHVEAPTGGSVILAGVLLKMGGYGFLRFSLPMFPEASQYFAPMMWALSIIAIIYTSLVALVQTDMKKMIAYSSVAHMGFVTLGIFTFTRQGMDGAIFQMISHGIVSGALFLIVGVVYDRLHSRDINRYGGIVKNMPVYATLFMVFTLGSVGLPGTSGFVGEFLSLAGAYQASSWVALLAGTGVVLGATYMLWLYRKVVFGPADNADAASMSDVSAIEKINLIPLAIMVIALGVMPRLVLEPIGASVEALMDHAGVHMPMPGADPFAASGTDAGGTGSEGVQP
ncbi:MAG: NADH-quinone oxidoreductase subunit M [Rhodospirillales bacterium]|nr:NADH-quinone oxidoreductase subunit M [Rhodospirillales bacterium]USO07799.1 MAG: NADH-quinone oxidoreductase subunit M [Rhodospirillales bacterium]